MPITPTTYTPRPYVRGGTIGELIRLRGRNQAEAHLRSGDISAQLWANLGNQLASTIQGYAKERQDAPIRAQEAESRALALQGQRQQVDAADRLNRQDTAFMALLEQQPTPDPKEVMSIYGPQRGMQIAQGLHAFGELQAGVADKARENAGRLAIAMKQFSPAMRTHLAPAVRAAAIKGGLGDEQSIPADLSDDFLDGVIGWSTGQGPAAPPALQRVEQRHPDGTTTTRFVQPTPDTEITSAAPAPTDFEWVTRSGRPVQIPKGTAQAGDRPYQPPSQAQGPQPGYQWVNRAGRPVYTNQPQDGDEPLRAPQNTGDTAMDRQRNARTTAAGDFLARLNELRAKINTRMGPAAGIAGASRRAGARFGMDPDVAEYERIRAAGGRALAVAIMGAQNLSDADASAWSNMLPDALTDEETAKRLTTQVQRMLEGMTGSGEAAGGGNSDPLGLGLGR